MTDFAYTQPAGGEYQQQQDEKHHVPGANGHGGISATGLPELPNRPAYKLPEETEEYIAKVEAEMQALGTGSPLVRALAERELNRIKAGEISEQGYVIVHKDYPIKVVKKVLIPVKEFPKTNFVGRLLGPKGATLKALQATSRSKIMIFGRGSMWDKNKNSGRGSEEYKNKEEEARNSGDPKYAHLNEDLHVYCEITAYPVEAQSRFAHVLSELKKFLDPNHPSHFQQGFTEAGPGLGIRPPMGPRPAYPGAYRGPHPSMGAPPGPRGYGAPRPPGPPAAAPTYDTSGYYATPAAADPAAADAAAAYGYAAYPPTDYTAASSNPYETQAQQAAQYAAQRNAAQPAYGQTPGYAAPGYAAAAAPAYGAAAWAGPTKAQPPTFSQPAAKKPRLAAPYGAPTY